MGTFRNAAVWIPPFLTDEVSAAIFGGFLCDKYVNSQPNATGSEGSPDVAHDGAAGLVPGISRPAVPVWDNITLAQAMIACANKGKGWHLMTPFEWASLAHFSLKYATLPHGGNGNIDPPADVTFVTEAGVLDGHLHGENGASHRPLPGSGPNIWSHNRQASGVFDLAGLVRQWIMMFMTTGGYLMIPAVNSITYTGSPFGRGTVTGSGGSAPALTCDGTGDTWLKSWTADGFNGMKVFIAETNAFYDVVDTTATGLVLGDGDDPGDGLATFVVVRTVSTDITDGMTSGQKILTLRDSDADLGPLAIPATADNTGAAKYGCDGFLFDVAATRGACRGGCFSDGTAAGIFALDLSAALTDADETRGFRACKTT